MGIFENRAAAFSWNTKGECFGVILSKDGGKFKVLNYWTEKASSSGGVAASLSKGQSALGLKENDTVIVGEMGMRCSFTDLQMPAMQPKDIQRSLSFSLSSHFPVDPENLHWAFRIVKEKDASGQAIVRLLAIENKHWDDWLDSVGTLKVDQIIPAVAVADSVLEKPVFIPKSDNLQSSKIVAGESSLDSTSTESKGFLINKNEEGLQVVSICKEQDLEDTFGAGENPLSSENLDLGALSEKSGDYQKRFAQAVLMALHGLTANQKLEAETSFPVPVEMSPKRNVFLTTLCSALAVYLLALGIFQVSKFIGTRKKEAANIRAVTEKIMADSNKNAVDTKQLEALEQLKFEIDEKIDRSASPKDVLSLITKNLPKEFYLSNFQFRQDKATCKVKKSDVAASTSDLFKIFKKIDFFEDDVQIDEGSKEITLVLEVKKRNLAEETQ
ncbi:MAG: hypothetical protein MK132_20630 [Lentisphaerales bacterium]|nr:hypothetical protein [Lentisphaerales bacterium]